jgi:hypothetical protein
MDNILQVVVYTILYIENTFMNYNHLKLVDIFIEIFLYSQSENY